MEVALTEARRLAARIDDPQIAQLADLCETAATSLSGDWSLALARAEALARHDDDRGLPWSRSVRQLQELRALFHLGRWSALQAKLPAALAAAEDRDDRVARVWTHALHACLQLAAGDPDAARRDLAAAEAAWPAAPAHGYHVQHLQIAEARTAVLLHTGEVQRAWQTVHDDAPHLARAGFTQAPALHALALDVRARSALAAWRRQPRDQALRRAALRAADDLQAVGARGHADLVRAGAHDPDLTHAYTAPQSVRLLRSAAAAFEASHLGIHLAVARIRLGEPAGPVLLAAQGIRDPDRLAAVLAP
jgi:hypothetical protein